MPDEKTPERLLPCPFCGCDADISHDHTVEENHAYGCRKCGLWFDTFNSDDPVTAWNSRAALSAMPAQQVVVKPLVWLSGGFEQDADFVDTTFTYQIQEGNYWYGAEVMGIACGTNKAAKAAAQAHHAAAILSQIEVCDVTVQEAAKIALAEIERQWREIYGYPKDHSTVNMQRSLAFLRLRALADPQPEGE